MVRGLEGEIIMRKSWRVLLLSGCIALPFAGQSLAQGLSVGGENGVSADVNTSDGIGADVSVGGADGVNAGVGIGGSSGVADVDVSAGGSDGANAKANVGGGGGLDADADVSLGGRNGVNAGATLGTGAGIDAGTTASIGGGRGAASEAGLLGLGSTGIGAAAVGGTGAPGAGGLTGPQLQAFQAMSDGEQRNLLNRCADIASGGGDAALVSLCRMLRMSASR